MQVYRPRRLTHHTKNYNSETSNLPNCNKGKSIIVGLYRRLKLVKILYHLSRTFTNPKDQVTIPCKPYNFKTPILPNNRYPTHRT